MSADRIFDGRLIFRCSKCKVCSIVPPAGGNTDEAYLDFLDRCESGSGVASAGDLRLLMEQEKIVRPAAEVDAMMAKAGVSGDPLLEEVLRSEHDYIVDFSAMEEPPPEHGSSLEELPVDQAIIDTLSKKGIGRLYRFQEQAIREILQGRDVVITAPTASGKTEAFCIPILQKMSEEIVHFGSLRLGGSGGGKDRGSTAKTKMSREAAGGRVSAIFVYPTKALARDQLPKIRELADPLGIRAAVLDGDTPEEDRKAVVLSPPDVIITNFDVLHYHMMHRTALSRIMTRSVRFLVVDEAHVYTGVFGANVHHIIARLERLASAAGGDGGAVKKKKLQIAAASATLPNAGEFCQALFGRKMQVVQGRGRRGRINLSIIFPSLRSHRSLTIDLVKQAAAKRKHRTIAFSSSHLGSELTAFYAARQGVSIRVHRAGLSPAARKEVEAQFRSGQIMAISATPTLELGIDIGDVAAVVSNIVPVNRLVQRIGRAARRGQDGYAFLALGNDPISQYYKGHPADYLSDHEYAYTDPSNPFVKEYQALAMACDRPLSMAESKPYWDALQKLVAAGMVRSSNGKFFVSDLRKAMNEMLGSYSIRGIGGRVDIKLGSKLVGERALPQALEELHQNAIYFLGGRRYQVKELHYEQGRQAYAELVPVPSDYPYYTKAITDEWPSILEVHERRQAFGVEAAYCSLRIKKRVLGYANIEIGQQEVGQGRKVMLDAPVEYEFTTKGFVFRAPRPSRTAAGTPAPAAGGAAAGEWDQRQYVEMSAFHASEHVIIEGSAMITGGASQDMGGISLGSSGLIFVYDGSVGGNGASRVLYDRLEKAFGRALRILSECPCTSESGCPRCTYSYRCGNNNEYLHKAAAAEVLERIVEGEKTQVGSAEDAAAGDRALV